MRLLHHRAHDAITEGKTHKDVKRKHQFFKIIL